MQKVKECITCRFFHRPFTGSRIGECAKLGGGLSTGGAFVKIEKQSNSEHSMGVIVPLNFGCNEYKKIGT